MVEEVKILVDVDAMFTGAPVLDFPTCKLSECVKGDFLKRGLCGRNCWCEHATRNPAAVKRYHDPHRFDQGDIFAPIPLVFQKLQELNWSLSFWTTRPRNQYSTIVKALKKAKVWDEAIFLGGDGTLLRTPPSSDEEDTPETLKLSILERDFGEWVGDPEKQLILVEQDRLEASTVKKHAPNVIIQWSPTVWLNMLGTSTDSMLQMMKVTQELRESSD